MKKGQKTSGFSLVELLITVSIISIIIAIGIASYSTINRQSRDTKRKSDIEQLRASLEMYKSENGYYPAAGSGSWVDAATGLTATLVSTYITAVPTDPISAQSYMYRATNQLSGNYYGYCLSSALENEDPADTCTPDTGHNYGQKSP